MSVPKEAERTIYLVNPRTPGVRLAIGPYSLGVPTGLGVAGSMAERVRDEAGFENEVDIRVIDEDLRQRANPKPGDLVLVTSFSLTAQRVQTLIREVNDQGAFVITGGIHATFAPDDFSREGAINFMGEAGNSVAFSELINRWLHSGTLDRGIRVESEGLGDPRSIKLAGLPVSEQVYKGLDQNRLVHSTFATLGCPHNCEFCTVMAGRVVRTRPVGEVVNEIKLRGLDKMGFTIADSDLGGGGTKAGNTYLLQLLEALAPLEIPRAWNSEITIKSLDRGGDQLFDALRNAHCHRLFVGIESPNTDNLQSVGKKHNLEYGPDEVKEIVGKAHKRGIKITGLFIVGFRSETVESVRDIERYIEDTRLDDANIFIMTPLPGSAIWSEFAATGLFDPQTLDTDQLDLRHLVFKHPLGNEVLLKEYERLCSRVFSLPAVLSRSTRAFFMSLEYHLPESLERVVRNSYGTGFLFADEHRGAHIINFANRVYDTWRQLSRQGN